MVHNSRTTQRLGAVVQIGERSGVPAHLDDHDPVEGGVLSAPSWASVIELNQQGEDEMKGLVFALQFKGRAHPVEGVEGKLAAKTRDHG